MGLGLASSLSSRSERFPTFSPSEFGAHSSDPRRRPERPKRRGRLSSARSWSPLPGEKLSVRDSTTRQGVVRAASIARRPAQWANSVSRLADTPPHGSSQSCSTTSRARTRSTPTSRNSIPGKRESGRRRAWSRECWTARAGLHPTRVNAPSDHLSGHPPGVNSARDAGNSRPCTRRAEITRRVWLGAFCQQSAQHARSGEPGSRWKPRFTARVAGLPSPPCSRSGVVDS